ncbi:MAG TPA: lipoyl synthase [Clostridiales bacterium]|nr:lipoyl synthase [Clostridiales bacterium]
MNAKPDWLRIRHTHAPNIELVEEVLRNLNLHTVCREAHCPNYGECFAQKTATFMILGTHCTRNCRFCNVSLDQPQQIDPEEPAHIAQAVKELGLTYVVVTSVTRDDLADGGAGHFAAVIRAIKNSAPSTAVEVLIPDLMGNLDALKLITEANPTVISHNMETVKHLYSAVRPQAEYKRSLRLLEHIKLLDPKIRSKSGIMVGLGETKEQVHELFGNLRAVNCEFLTIGQYLAPSKAHFPVQEYIEPSLFVEYGNMARQMGFDFVASAPLVRSSYHAGEAIRAN